MLFIKQFESEEEEQLMGINPMKLAVALVVITISIAAVLSFWASGIGDKNVKKREDCSIASFRLYSGTYDSSTSSLLYVLENLQSSELKDLTLYLFYHDKTVIERPMKENLEGNKIKTYNFNGIPKDFEKGLIKTNCPDVTLQFIEQNGTLKQI